MFRPGYIQPIKGVRSKTGWYQALYTVAAPLSPLMQRFFPGVSMTTAILGRAMIQAAAVGYSKRILEPRDINELGAGSQELGPTSGTMPRREIPYLSRVK